MPLNVFISHSHSDAEIAKAVRDLIDRTFETEVAVRVSSGSVGEGGIAAGEQWLNWITETVRSSPVALVLFTPGSLSRPWLMWEAGAVRGVGEALAEKRWIVPVFFRMGPTAVPSPLQNLNAVPGDEATGVARLLDTIEEQVANKHPGQRERRKTVVPEYLKAVDEALSGRPQPLTEDLVVEWCERIDDFHRTGRYADLGHLHRALLLAVAAGPKPGEAVLDVRLHRRLGELYLDRGQGPQAAEQFSLALKVVPRDIFLLHRLGMAQCESRSFAEAAATLDKILLLDAESVLVNPEIAGLKGRISRHRWVDGGDREDLRAARDAYRDAFDRNPDSLYLAVNVGELSLALDEREAGLAAFDRAIAIVDRQGDHGLWSLSTRALARAAHAEWDEVLPLLRTISAVPQVPRELESFRQALRRLARSVGDPSPEVAEWMDRPTAG